MKKYSVKIQASYRDRPEEYGLSAAFLIAKHFAQDVTFLKRSDKKTPDLLVGAMRWELKSPTGNSKNTIRNNLSIAKHQSPNVIVDLRRSKLHQLKAISNIKHYVAQGHRSIKHIKIITKTGKIVDIL